jgi:aryl-alcohol dehydrogenase-like predicted oxidoreductase
MGAMETRRIGGLEVSVVGLGTNNFGRRLDERQTADVVHAALDSGITHFDTADVYAGGDSERLLGRALGPRRDEAIIATKFGNPVGGRGGGGSPDYLRRALEASLDRLGTDRVDLLWLHRPDPATPIGDTLLAADEQRRAGRIRAFGLSNVTPRQLAEALEASDRLEVPVAAVQNEYSLLVREPEEGVLDLVERAGLAFVPYFPLASGLLTGKYRSDRPIPEGTRLSSGAGDRWLTHANLRAVDELDAFARERGHSLLELAFAWLLDRPAVASVIAGAMTVEQVRANAEAPAGWHLTDAERARVDEIVARAPVEAS